MIPKKKEWRFCNGIWIFPTCYISSVWNLIFYSEGGITILRIFGGRTKIQNIPFNLKSDSSQLLTIWHLKKVVPSLKFCFLPEKLFLNETDRPQRHDQNGLHECLTSGNMICPDTFSPISTTSLFYEDPENTEEDPD